METKIIPQIKEIQLKTQSFKLNSFFLSDDILEKLPIANCIFSHNQKGENLFEITHSFADIDKEAYRIVARSENIEILTSTVKGLMYALFTLSELALLNDDTLVEFDVYDEPSLKLRASSDDISRGQISTTNDFFEIIKKLARYKYNTYMPYIEDVFKFDNIPDWGKYSDPITKSEWKVIIAFAKEYQIEIRPIVNLLGHFNKLSYIKSLQPLALKRKDGSASHVMDVKNPLVRDYIKIMLDEIVEVFGVGIIHAGGDEPVDLTEVFGKEEGAELFIAHYTFISNELKKRGCSMMMYADFFAPPWGDYAVPIDRAKELPPETDFVFWDYEVRKQYPFVDALHEQNLNMYISPGSWTWKRFSCDIKLCYNNTKGLLTADNGRSKGMIMSSWADGGDTLRELVWPGVLVGANFCWAPSSTYSYEEIYELIHKSLFGFDSADAWLLDNVYHHDSLIKRKHQHEFKLCMFASPFEPVKFEDRENINLIQEAMEKAKGDMQKLKPLRNQDAFNALLLTVARTVFTANRIAKLPTQNPTNMEDAIPYSQVAIQLACDLVEVKDLHEKLWFNNNRYSEWATCRARYEDLCDQLQIFSRNIKSTKQFETH